MQGKVCGKKRHTKTEIRSEISELICGRIAAGENYNLTRDIMEDSIMNNKMINVKERIDAMETMINGGKKEPSAVDKLKAAEYGSAFWNHISEMLCCRKLLQQTFWKRRDKSIMD